jgi:hypothetical protein
MPNYTESLSADTYSNAKGMSLEQAYMCLDESDYQSQAFSATFPSLLDCSKQGNRLLDPSTSPCPSFINAYEPLMIEVFEEYGHPYGMMDC